MSLLSVKVWKCAYLVKLGVKWESSQLYDLCVRIFSLGECIVFVKRTCVKNMVCLGVDIHWKKRGKNQGMKSSRKLRLKKPAGAVATHLACFLL